MSEAARPSPQIAAARPKRSRKRRAESGGGAPLPRRNTAESPIAWLFNRRDSEGHPLISEAQFNAGEKLRADFWFGQMTPRTTQSWSPAAVSGAGRRGASGFGGSLSDSVMAAQDRVRRALEAVGEEHAGVLIDVCCHLKGLEDVEKRAGWPRRSAKIVLSLALSALARYYGLAAARQAEPRVAAVRHWGAPGYRPTLADDEENAEDEGGADTG